MRPRPRRLLAVLGLALAAVGPLACSSGDERSADEPTTTTTAPRLTRCQIHQALETMDQLPPPTGPQEARDAVDFIGTVYGQVVADAPPERAEQADELRSAVANLRAEAEGAGYSGAFLTGPPRSLSTPAVDVAIESFREDYAGACGEPDGG